jgi:ferric-dicitrate binding protein FerR (iron transport regulator)
MRSKRVVSYGRTVTTMETSINAKELHKIYEQAALWMIRTEDGPLSRCERRCYEAWLRLPHRAEALERMQAFNEQFEQPWRRRRLSMRLAACSDRAPPLSR